MDIKTSYTRLLVADLKACFEFYRDVLEFTVVIEALEDGYAEFSTPNMKLALFRRQEMALMIGSDRPTIDGTHLQTIQPIHLLQYWLDAPLTTP